MKIRILLAAILVAGLTANALTFLPQAKAANTPFHSPSLSGDPGEWTNGDNAFTSDDTYANTNDDNDDEGYRNFAFNIPDGVTIDGIEVALESKQEGITCELQTRLSWNGSNFTDRQTIVPEEDDTILTVGGATDTWGHSWTPSELNNDFVLEVRFNDPGSNCTTQGQGSHDDIFLDNVQVRVYYTEPAQPASNPELGQSCGLDIALVLDNSSSIDIDELPVMKSALHDFVNAFLPATPTQFSVTSFNTTATVVQSFTDDAATVNSAIDSVPLTPINGFTNWEDGLLKAQSTFDPRPNPNLVIFASDGNPNRKGNPADAVSESDAVQAAIIVANDLKMTNAARILALGIGNELDPANLEAISSADAVITGDFSTLASSLAELANELCGGTITVTKLIDADGDLQTTEDQTPGVDWDFNIAGSQQLTDQDGKTPAVEVDPGMYDVTETGNASFTLLDATCTNGQGAVGSMDGNTVYSVTVGSNDIVSCTFINTPVPNDPGDGGSGGDGGNGDTEDIPPVVTVTGGGGGGGSSGGGTPPPPGQILGDNTGTGSIQAPQVLGETTPQTLPVTGLPPVALLALLAPGLAILPKVLTKK